MADEQSQPQLTFEVDAQAGGYIMGAPLYRDEGAVIGVRFPGESEDMRFVVVNGADGWRVGLAFTLLGGITTRVDESIAALGANPPHEQILHGALHAFSHGLDTARQVEAGHAAPRPQERRHEAHEEGRTAHDEAVPAVQARGHDDDPGFK